MRVLVGRRWAGRDVSKRQEGLFVTGACLASRHHWAEEVADLGVGRGGWGVAGVGSLPGALRAVEAARSSLPDALREVGSALLMGRRWEPLR